jgi:RND family efflux transporter MFP subunit
MSVKVNGIGEVSSKEYYKIGSIYGGKVLDLTINEGEFIKKDTLIANIDSVDLKNKIDELSANIKKVKSDIYSLEIDKKSAIASYNYQNEILKRNKKLYNKGAISGLDYTKYKTNATTAQLKIKSIEAKINSLNSQKLQLIASLDGLKERLKRYTIVSPISGYVVKKYLSNYAIINPNQTILEIVDPKDVWISTHIDTRISGDIAIGNSASIKLRSTSKIYTGKVVNIKPINNNVTYEREVNVAFDNLPIPFYLQEQANVTIDTKDLKDIIKVPVKALTIYNQKEGVWIVKDSKVKFKAIKILAYSKNSVATKDISTEDKLVIPDPKKKSLTNGMKINEQ